MSSVPRGPMPLLCSFLKGRFARAILAIDCVLILVHSYVATRPWAARPAFFRYLRLDNGHGIPKMFECAMLGLGLVASIILIRRSGRSAFWLLGLLSLYLLIDDAFALHGFLGSKLYPSHRHFGELLSSLALGAVFGAWWLAEFLKSDHRSRIILGAAAAIIAYTMAFGVGVDAVHGAFVARHTLLDGVVTIIEEGNELIGLTLLGAFLLALSLWNEPAPRAARSETDARASSTIEGSTRWLFDR